MFDDAGNVATNQLKGYNADAVSVSLKQVSGNLKYAPTQAEISESAMKVKDTLEDIIGDRAHVVISDSMDVSEDGTKGTRAFLDPETGVFYVNNKFKFDERFTELATAIHELYHAAEGTKQSAELHRALGEFVQAFPEVADQLTGGVGETITNDIIEYFNPKLNAMQQGYVNATEIDADILGKLLGSEEYVAKLAVRNENLVKKLYTYLKAAGKSTQSKQVRRALDKLTKKFGNALDHAHGGVLVSQIRDDEEKESTPEGVNERMSKTIAKEEIIDLSEDNRLSSLVENLHGSERYNIIREYILKELENQPITLSDGKQAVVDRSDAKHIARNAGTKKASEISHIKRIIELAKLVAEEGSVKDGKFDYFWYYQANVLYEGEVVPVYVNVGRAKNDSSYHIYDITQKIRDTAHRVNDVGRPVGYALENGISNNTISQDKGIVNSNSTQNSEKDASSAERSSDINERRSITDRSYLDAVERGDLESAQKMVDEAAKKAGYTIKAYHGTSRSDRVGNVFLPERATSGPMAFFTDNKKIAENYAKSKQDTSIAYDSDFGRYETQFRIKTAYSNQDIPLYMAWGMLPFDARNRITKKAGQLHENWDGDYELILDTETNEANGGFQRQLKEARGNAIQALIEQWLNNGTLYNKEARFLDVLEMTGVVEEFKKIGMDSLYFKDPDARHEKVYDSFLKINNPFDTATVDEQFIAELEEWYENQDQDKYVRENMASDLWDKNGIDAYDFAERLRNDLEKGTTRAWTSIPDSITDYLKELGYDGIKDIGGKNGGDLHTVWIPFTSEQIKSAEAVTYDDNGNVIPLSKRFDTDNIDIRYSKTGNQVDNGSKTRYNNTYTEHQYNSFGWVRANDILTSDQYKDFTQKFAQIKNGKNKNYVKSASGSYIIAIGGTNDGYGFGIDNVLVYATGTIAYPKVEKIVKIDLYSEDDINIVRSFIYAKERNKNAQASYLAEDQYGEELVSNIRREDLPDYQRYQSEARARRSGGESGRAYKSYITKQDGERDSGEAQADRSINERSSKTGKDTIEMSKGEIEKLRANYQSEKVFDKKGVSGALNGIPMFKKLPSDVRGKLIESIWTGFNEHRAYDRYIDVTTERLYATIMQESDFALYELDVKESKDAEMQLKDEIKLALQRIVDGAKESTYSKMQKKAYAEVEDEIKALKAERDKLKKKNDENDVWTKSLTSLLRKIKTLEDKNSGKYVSASQYNLSTFKGAVKALGKVIWRGDINVTSARKQIAKLSEWYGELENGTPKNTMLTGIYSEDVAQSLKDIATEKGKLTVEELDKIRDIADHFIFVLENDKKVFLNGKYEDAPAKAKEFVKLIQSNAGKDIGALRMFWNTYLEYCGDPMMIFRRMDKYKRGFWTTMGEELRAAAAGAAIFEMETRAPIEEFLSKHKKFLNDLENKTVTYNGTEIPLGIGMNLYCTLKREQAQRGLML